MLEQYFMKERLKQMLREGCVEFEYTKKDGTTRIAVGTTKLDLFKDSPNYKESKGERKVSSDIITYWDLDKDGWRSFNGNQLTHIFGEL